MTYSSGSLIQATDYNGFVSTTAGANVNDIWGVGSGDKGWGQTALGTVSTGGTVTATQWASLVNTMASMGNQTFSSFTARTAPVVGDTIGILAALNTDLTTFTTNRGNARFSGSNINAFTGSVSKTTGTAANAAGWTITFTNTIVWPSADQARYFWNAGGLVRIDMSKTSTGTDKDADWNTFVGTVGTLYLSGRVNSAAQTIAGTSYTGFTRIGGSGVPGTNLSTTGWYSLTSGAAATTMWQLNDTVSPYTGDYIRITASRNDTTLVITTTWVDAGYSGAGKSNDISGGTATATPFSTFGTAPTVISRPIQPSAVYIGATWGTPTVSSTAA